MARAIVGFVGGGDLRIAEIEQHLWKWIASIHFPVHKYEMPCFDDKVRKIYHEAAGNKIWSLQSGGIWAT